MVTVDLEFIRQSQALYKVTAVVAVDLVKAPTFLQDKAD
jgi:hypothetical protein